MTGKPIETAKPGDFIGIIHADKSFRLFKLASVGKDGSPLLAWLNETARQLVCEIALKGEVFALTQNAEAIEWLWKRGKVDYGNYWTFTCAIGRAKIAAKYDGKPRMSSTLYSDVAPADTGVKPEPQTAPSEAPAKPDSALNSLEASTLASRRLNTDHAGAMRFCSLYDMHVDLLGATPREAFTAAEQAVKQAANKTA